jgi:hypothetical protein
MNSMSNRSLLKEHKKSKKSIFHPDRDREELSAEGQTYNKNNKGFP